jgi:lipopolysaccharide export system protein LptA
MVLKLRRFYIWLASLLAVLAIFLLYTSISKTPHIEIGTEVKSTDTLSEFGSKIGMVGDVGVGTIKMARFQHYNENKEVDREFGFERLLHEIGNEWEIEKPYMNIFRQTLKCYITADRGTVQVEEAVGRPTMKDATFTGNVVVHILPEEGSDIKEGFVYLDDIAFISEESQFSTAGPVKFVSEDARMLGRGLELVYNDEAERLEFLKIIHLETLRLKTSSKASLFSSPEKDTTSQTKPQRQPELIAADVSQKEKPTPQPSQQVAKQADDKDYKCVFSKNVVVDSPNQLIFADEVSINNITSDRTEETIAPQQGKADTTGADKAKAASAPAAKTGEPRVLDEQLVDIVITCDNGILVTPMSSAHKPNPVDIERKIPENFNDTGDRPTFVAQKIDYSVSTENVLASGPSELKFYIDDVMGGENEQTTVPVKITAGQKAAFSPALNQVAFEGSVLCTMLRENLNIQQKYKLSAQKLTVDLSKDKQSEANIEHLTASDGVVQLDTSRWTGEELLGFTKLKCLRFDYYAAQQLFLATGPGLIALDNSKISQPKARLPKFSLQKQCTAIVQNFETLKYFSKENQIIADAKQQRIAIDYFPIIHDQYGRQVTATAGHIKAELEETYDGQSELSTLTATSGITYDEEAEKGKWRGKRAVHFVGSELFYDAYSSEMTAWGDESQPCLLNGVPVEGIEYNLKSGRAKSKIVGPGAFR